MLSLAEQIAQLPPEHRLPAVMEALEAVLAVVPVDQLRALVACGESLMGKGNPALPSGAPFDKATRKGRLWLDLIDDMVRLDEEFGR